MAAHLDTVARYPKLVGAAPKTTYHSGIHHNKPELKSNNNTIAKSSKSNRTSSFKAQNSQMNCTRPNSLPLMAPNMKENKGKKWERKPEISTVKTISVKPYSLPGTPIDESLLKCYKDLLIRFSKAQVALEELSLQNSAQQETIKNWRPILREAILVGSDGRSCISSSKSSSSCCNSSNFPRRERLIMTPRENDHTLGNTAKINNSILKCQEYLDKSKFHCQPSHMSQASSSSEISAHPFQDVVRGKESQDSTSSQNTILQNILQIQAIEEKLDALQQTFTLDDLLSMGSDGEKTQNKSTVKADTFLQTWTKFKQHWNAFQENANTLIQDHCFNNLGLDEQFKELDLGSQNELWDVEEPNDLVGGTEELTIDFLRSELARLEKKVESFQEAVYCVLDEPTKTGLGANLVSKPFEPPPDCMTASLDSQTSSIITVVEKRRDDQETESTWSRHHSAGSQDLSPQRTPSDLYGSRSPLYSTSTLKKGSHVVRPGDDSIGNIVKATQIPTYTVPYSFGTKLSSNGKPVSNNNNMVDSMNRSYEKNYATLSRSDNMIDNFNENSYKGRYENFDNTAIYCTPLRYACTKHSPLLQGQDLKLPENRCQAQTNANDYLKKPRNPYYLGTNESHIYQNLVGNPVSYKRSSAHSKSYDEAAQTNQPLSGHLDSTYSINDPPFKDLSLGIENHYQNLFQRCSPSYDDVWLDKKVTNRSYHANLNLESINSSSHRHGCRYSLNKTHNHLALPDFSKESRDVIKLNQCPAHHCKCSVRKERIQSNFPLHLYKDYLNSIQASVKTHDCGCCVYQNCSCVRPLSLYSLKEKRSSNCTKQLKKLIRNSDGIYYLHQAPGHIPLAPCCELEPLPTILLAENVHGESKLKRTLKIKANTLKLRLIKRGSDDTRCAKGLEKNHSSSTLSLSKTFKDDYEYRNELVKNECHCKQRHKNGSTITMEKDNLNVQLGVRDIEKRAGYDEKPNPQHQYRDESYGVHRGLKHGEIKVKQKKKKTETVKNSEKYCSKAIKQPKSTNDIKALFQNIVNIFKSNADKSEQTSF